MPAPKRHRCYQLSPLYLRNIIGMNRTAFTPARASHYEITTPMCTYLTRYIHEGGRRELSQRLHREDHEFLGRVTREQVDAELPCHSGRVGVVVHVPEDRYQLELHAGGSGLALDHISHLVAHADRERPTTHTNTLASDETCTTDRTYLDWAAKWIAAYIAASTSTLSCESRLHRMLWCTCCRSGMIPATAPSVRSVSPLAIGSLLWITLNTLLTNSSTFDILSRCFSLCWHTRSTHNRRKLVLQINVVNRFVWRSACNVEWITMRYTCCNCTQKFN